MTRWSLESEEMCPMWIFLGAVRRHLLRLTTVLAALGIAFPLTDAHAVNWDYTHLEYGTEDPDRQWLNIYQADGSEPAPIFMYSHANGGSADTDGTALSVVEAGYTLVSWESVTPLVEPEDGITAAADAQLAFDWIRANASTYNLDSDRVIVGGRSRGSVVSWPLGHSGHEAIEGLYFYNALPDSVWEYPGLSDPLGFVGAQSPPLYLAFGPLPNDGDPHNPANLYPVVEAYEVLGHGDEVWLQVGMGEAGLQPWHYFPELVAALEDVDSGDACDALDSSCVACGMGDVNGDDILNVLDVVALLSHLLGLAEMSTDPCAGDVTGDDELNVSDVVMLVDMILDLDAAIDEALEGYSSLFIGHSFFAPIAYEMPSMTLDAGITDHIQEVVFSGGETGAPLALWENDVKRDAIQAILDGGDIQLFGMTCCSEGLYTLTEAGPLYNGPDSGIIQWMDYALEQNAETRFALALPWPDYPESYVDGSEYAAFWHAGHELWHVLIDDLRALYPDTEIFCIPHGQAALELRLLFESGNLGDVDAMTSGGSDSIFNDGKGHADQMLKNLAGLIWLSAIYEVDLAAYPEWTMYETDLNGLAEAIVDGHSD